MVACVKVLSQSKGGCLLILTLRYICFTQMVWLSSPRKFFCLQEWRSLTVGKSLEYCYYNSYTNSTTSLSHHEGVEVACWLIITIIWFRIYLSANHMPSSLKVHIKFKHCNLSVILSKFIFWHKIQTEHHQCTPYYEGPQCICAVAARAGRDVFVIDLCEGNGAINFELCEDNVLQVFKIHDKSYKVLKISYYWNLGTFQSFHQILQTLSSVRYIFPLVHLYWFTFWIGPVATTLILRFSLLLMMSVKLTVCVGILTAIGRTTFAEGTRLSQTTSTWFTQTNFPVLGGF